MRAWWRSALRRPRSPSDSTNVLSSGFSTASSCCFAAPVILPLVLLLGLLIRSDGGPAFYSQERIGLNGRVFRIWKLRSMRVGADQLLEAHLAADPAARAEWETTQKLKDDPRVTPIGRSIRRNSLDELPQLWNVLKGDMSLVGPRPMMPDQARSIPASPTTGCGRGSPASGRSAGGTAPPSPAAPPMTPAMPGGCRSAPTSRCSSPPSGWCWSAPATEGPFPRLPAPEADVTPRPSE